MTYHGFFYGAGHAAARDAGTQASHASSNARKAKTEGEALAERFDRLALMTEALWLLLRDRLGVTEEELTAIARDLDLSDGRLDGRVRRASAECASCGRMVGKNRAKCLYCGTPMDRAPFTDV